jgi:hypothetical protein
MRGGGTRTGYLSRSVNNVNRRRRERYARDAERDPWGLKRNLMPDDEDWDDEEADTAC